MPREDGAVVLDAALALDHAGKQVAVDAQHSGDTAQQRDNHIHGNADIRAGKGLHAVCRYGVDEGGDHAEHHGAQHTADGTLHRLFGADHRAQLMLAEGAACKIGTGIAAPCKAEDEQDEENRVIAEFFHWQTLLEQNEGVEAEDHDARKHQKTAGLLVADGTVAHHQIDGKKGDQHKRHGHDQLAHGAVAGKHDQQCVGYQHCVHEPVLFFKAEGAVNLVDGDQGDGCDHQIEHHGVEGKHHANEHQNAHDRSNNACFHRFDLLCSSGSSPLQGNAFRPEEVPGLSGLHLRCRVCNTVTEPLRCRRTGGCGG